MSHDRGCFHCGADTIADKAECFRNNGKTCVKAALFDNKVFEPINPHMIGFRRIYCDMDGVVADFDGYYRKLFGHSRQRHSGWDDVRATKAFYRKLPVMPDFEELWKVIKPLKPFILTGIPASVDQASNDKIWWAKRHCGAEVPVICCLAKEKSHYCRPGDVIIDDTPEYRPLWEKAGGVWIHHESAKQSINALRLLGIVK